MRLHFGLVPLFEGQALGKGRAVHGDVFEVALAIHPDAELKTPRRSDENLLDPKPIMLTHVLLTLLRTRSEQESSV
jgi:hypothetical protein